MTARTTARARAANLPRIGCAGWSILSAHRDLFGAGDNLLARYATRFDAVEINSSFYRSHRRETYERWAAGVPAGFRFSVKVPQQITHDAALRGTRKLLAAFLDEVAGLGRKLGGLLIQLPPHLAFDARSANAFFSLLRRSFEGPVACEPRHASWFEARLDALWLRHDVSRVAADPPRVAGGDRPAGSTRWRYWRWHGSPRIYYSDYDDERLAQLADLTRSRNARSTWCIFDNTAGGHAVPNAARLQQLVSTRSRRHA
jgi:uncharacterized protein YecE (DUF72 family)